MKKLYEFRATLALIIGVVGLFSLWLNGYLFEYQAYIYSPTYVSIAWFMSFNCALFGMVCFATWATKSREEK